MTKDHHRGVVADDRNTEGAESLFLVLSRLFMIKLFVYFAAVELCVDVFSEKDEMFPKPA